MEFDGRKSRTTSERGTTESTTATTTTTQRPSSLSLFLSCLPNGRQQRMTWEAHGSIANSGNAATNPRKSTAILLSDADFPRSNNNHTQQSHHACIHITYNIGTVLHNIISFPSPSHEGTHAYNDVITLFCWKHIFMDGM
jgi:hypothetical protein